LGAFDDSTALVESLNRIGLLGDKYNWSGEMHHKLGDKFFDLIAFAHSHTVILMGDSANGIKEVGRTDSRNVCHIHISEVAAEPKFLGAANTLPPLCPSCHYEPEDPFNIIGDWYDNRTTFLWQCPNCQRDLSIHELDWRKRAGFARQKISIWEVRAGEASPTEQLLDFLASITGTHWTYFYYHL
jgi:hypothetical protein